MIINWFTVIAQWVNFTVLVLLLWRFLYRPIVNAMDERERRIGERIESAENTKQQAEQEAEENRRQRREIDETKDGLLAEARRAADTHRKELMDKARADVDGIQAAWKQTIEREKELFLQSLARELGKQTLSVARRALAELADADLEKHMIAAFIKRVRALDEDERRKLLNSLAKSGNELVVSTAFEVPESERRKISDAFKDSFGPAVKVVLEERANVICGIECKSRDLKLAWSVESYIQELEENLAATLDQQTAARSGAAAPQKSAEKETKK